MMVDMSKIPQVLASLAGTFLLYLIYVHNIKNGQLCWGSFTGAVAQILPYDAAAKSIYGEKTQQQ
jgi:hypothetical protein